MKYFEDPIDDTVDLVPELPLFEGNKNGEIALSDILVLALKDLLDIVIYGCSVGRTRLDFG